MSSFGLTEAFINQENEPVYIQKTVMECVRATRDDDPDGNGGVRENSKGGY